MNNYIMTNLMNYIFDKDLTGAAYMLELYPESVNTRDRNGFYPLYAAAQEGSVEIVKTLLDKGADPNARTWNERKENSEKYMSLLKEAGIDPGTAMISVEQKTPIFIASANGFSDIVDLLLEAGADPNLGFVGEATPLYIACQNNNFKTVQTLLTYGADVNLASKGGLFPLYIASQNGNEGIVKLLLDKGADAGLRLKMNNQGNALHVASEHGYLAIVKLLIQKGAYVNATTKQGFSALIIASEKGRTEIVKLLLDSGASAHIPSHEGVTPLMMASYGGWVDIVKLLLVSGANPDQSDNQGITSIMIAQKENFKEILKLFRTNKGNETKMISYDGSLGIETRRKRIAIDDFYNCFDSKDSWEPLKEIIAEIVPEVTASTIEFDPSQITLYRVRKNSGNILFTDIADLLYPPSAITETYGRCNRPHSPLLYTSLNPMIPLQEVKGFEKGDILTEIKYGIKQGMTLTASPIGINTQLGDNNLPFSKEKLQELELINSFLNDLLTQSRTDEKYYMLTNYLIETYFDFAGVSGFVYPSVRRNKSKAAYENFAIKPEEADRKLIIESVKVFQVMEIQDNGVVKELKCIQISDNIREGKVYYTDKAKNEVASDMQRNIELEIKPVGGNQMLHYFDLRSMKAAVNQIVNYNDINEYLKLKCPKCGYSFLADRDSEISNFFKIMQEQHIPVLGPGHECPRCKEKSPWTLWMESSQG